MGFALKFSKYLIKFVKGRLRENLQFKYGIAQSKQMSKNEW